MSKIHDAFADYHARERKRRIVDATIIIAWWLSTHVLAGIIGAYVWHLSSGCLV